MKVYSIISEEIQIDELNLGLTSKGRQMKRADKDTKKVVGGEIRDLEVELLTYMKNSGNKRATPTLVKNYLKQKGLGTAGNAIVDQVAAKNAPRPGNPVGFDRQEPPVTSGGAPPAGDAGGAPPLGSPVPPAPLARGAKSKTNNGEEFTWLGAQWRGPGGRMANKAQKDELVANASKQTNSMYSEAVEEAPLSKRQIQTILKQVIQKAYGDNAGFNRSRFGEPQAGGDAEVQGMIDKLKQAGYKVTK
jgi:hypothetical protein